MHRNFTQKKRKMADKREAFNKVFDDLLAFIVEDARANEVPEHHIEYLKRVRVF